MKHFLTTILLAILASASSTAYAQQTDQAPTYDVRATPAYGVLVLRKSALEAELNELLGRFSEDHPQLKLTRFEFDALVREMERMNEMPESSIGKLTSGYGMLIVRKAALRGKIQFLLLSFTPEHPEVKSRKAELAAIKREMREIMR